MNREIKFCTTNYSNGTDKIKEDVQRFLLDLEVVEENCLGHCGQCYEECFVKVEEEYIAINNYEELEDKLNRLVKK